MSLCLLSSRASGGLPSIRRATRDRIASKHDPADDPGSSLRSARDDEALRIIVVGVTDTVQ
ncbi:hypothetical protein BVIR_2228 [Blastochloris viridis]|uniref:Uncharacterized protein n=1 Tax=Blastochloris viridis TaxID=1079 RepID=A0A0P0ISF1_BLAVI|nr:hypothetical protein BVIR_2228 [Blastochloris viridis]CUU42660.1 hypothetical protein BVIRIDIS_16740 [Blastochloris viridis]